ncbi:hypothetical protein [Streptantibioticus ferralitis]|uniref:Histidine kinase/HSP90-like ATPase domain-containing protein n=1 Tax=Streptantibioticus ferralitis TaxID=236510 RepID=A0ABT5YUQ5_9ACTN|nr:hypothetical protein [Streptantibioticus ferralitis]MDF2255334.1 hypothetical protein [Streptantibioticus ferralitis]
MVKGTAAARLPLSDPRRSTLDVCWTFSLARADGSDALAERMTHAALTTIGTHDVPCAQIAEATALACRYVLDYGYARRYRVTLGMDDTRCTVSVTDYGYDQPPDAPATAALHAPPSHVTAELCHELSGHAVDGSRLDGVQVHHALDGAVLVRFRTPLPRSTDSPEPHPAAPDTSRSPSARG